MSKFKPRFTNNASAIPYTDGAMIFDTKTKKLRFDVNNESYEISSGATSTTTTTTNSGSGRVGGSVKGLPNLSEATTTKNYLAVDVPPTKIGITNAAFGPGKYSADFTDFYISRDFCEKAIALFTNEDTNISPNGSYGGMAPIYTLVETEPIFKRQYDAQDAPYRKLGIAFMYMDMGGGQYTIYLLIGDPVALENQDMERAMMFPILSSDGSFDGETEFENLMQYGGISVGNFVKLANLPAMYSLLDNQTLSILPDKDENDNDVARTFIKYTIPDSCEDKDAMANFLASTMTNEIPVVEEYTEYEPYLKWDSPLPKPTKNNQTLKAFCSEYKFEEEQSFDGIYIKSSLDGIDSKLNWLNSFGESFNARVPFIAGFLDEVEGEPLIAMATLAASKYGNFSYYNTSTEQFEVKTTFDNTVDTDKLYIHQSQLMPTYIDSPVNAINVTAENKDSLVGTFYGNNIASGSFSPIPLNYLDMTTLSLPVIQLYKKVTLPNDLQYINTGNNSGIWVIDTKSGTINRPDSAEALANIANNTVDSVALSYINYKSGNLQYDYEKDLCYIIDKGNEYYLNDFTGQYYFATRDENSSSDAYRIESVSSTSDILNLAKNGDDFYFFFNIVSYNSVWKDFIGGYNSYTSIYYNDKGNYSQLNLNNSSNIPELAGLEIFVNYEKFMYNTFDEDATGAMCGFIFSAIECGEYSNGFFKLNNGDYERIDTLEPDVDYYWYYNDEYLPVPENFYCPIFLSSTINGGLIFDCAWLPNRLNADNNAAVVLQSLLANGITKLAFNKVGWDERKEITYSNQAVVLNIDSNYFDDESFVNISDCISIVKDVFSGDVGNINYKFVDEETSGGGTLSINTFGRSSSEYDNEIYFNNDEGFSKAVYLGDYYLSDNPFIRIDLREYDSKTGTSSYADSLIIPRTYTIKDSDYTGSVYYPKFEKKSLFFKDGNIYEISISNNDDSYTSGNNNGMRYWAINNLNISIKKVITTFDPNESKLTNTLSEPTDEYITIQYKQSGFKIN